MTNRKNPFVFLLLFPLTTFCQQAGSPLNDPVQEEPGINDTIVQKNIQDLRTQLKYKFALNFLLEYQSTSNDSASKDYKGLVLTSTIVTPERTKKIVSRDPRVLEEFYCGDDYKLYKIKSLSQGKNIFLLVETFLGDEDFFRRHPHYGECTNLYLLGNDTLHWSLLDTFELPSHHGKCHLLKLNGCDIIKVEQSPWGTGYYSEDEAYLGVVDEKFKTLYGTKRIKVITSTEDEEITFRTIRKISFVDLNHDGFLDIVENERVEKVSGDVEMKNYSDFYKLKVLKFISKNQRKYLWNNMSLSFERDQ